MNWLVLSYFISIGTMSYQAEFVNPPVQAFYLTPGGTYQETFGAELLFADRVFVGGQVQTWNHLDGKGLFSPDQSLYTFDLGFRMNGVEIAWRHECDHITLPGTQIPGQGFLSNKDEISISYRGSVKLF